MRVLVWPAGHADRDASACYRLLFPAEALARQGADVAVDYTGPRVVWDRGWSGKTPPPEVQVVGLEVTPEADVVVLQRPGRRWWADLIPHLQVRGVGVVVDVDDAFWCIPRGNWAHDRFEHRGGSIHSAHWLQLACTRADLVTTSTPSLARYYGGQVLPNMVPAWYLKAEPEVHRDAVGWSGSTLTHPGDLEVTRGAVPEALRGSSFGFHVVGPGTGVAKALGLGSEPTTSGWVPIMEYPFRLAELGIGIVPLQDNEFNTGKSRLKGGEMASLGVPPIMSPTPDNQALHRLGVGILAAGRGAWRRALTSLLRSPQRRADLAGRGREVMATQTYAANCGRWWDAWAGAVRTRTPATT